MNRAFVPAAGHDFFLPLYDPLWRLLGGRDVRAAFIRAAGIASGQRVLDIGCGTGSLAIQIAESVPNVEIFALDPDPKALARAARKASTAHCDIHWNEGFADALPFDDASFDRVTSSFMFHHLDLETRRGMLREAARVLADGGELHLVDFGGSNPEPGRPDGWLARVLHSHEQRAETRVPSLLEAAGFADVAQLSSNRSVFGRYAHTRGVRRVSASA